MKPRRLSKVLHEHALVHEGDDLAASAGRAKMSGCSDWRAGVAETPADWPGLPMGVRCPAKTNGAGYINVVQAARLHIRLHAGEHLHYGSSL